MKERMELGATREGAAEAVLLELRRGLPSEVAVACSLIRDETSSLFPAEREAMSRAIERRRHEFATGRRLARDAMAQLGCAEVAIPVGDARGPVWPAGLVGSISHSSGLCAVAVAHAADIRTVGIDIERVGAVSPDVMTAIAHDAEIIRHGALLPEAELRAVLFSVREAVYKAYWPVTQSYLAHKEVEIDLDAGRFTARLLSDDRPGFLGRLSIEGRYGFAGEMVVSSVCVAE